MTMFTDRKYSAKEKERVIKLSYKNLFSIISFVLCFASIASAGVPNTFTAGTTAKSSEVNANFNFVNYGNIVVKANGVEIGTLISHRPGAGAYGGSVSILSPQGYSVSINANGNMEPQLMITEYFTTTDCTGTAYWQTSYTFANDIIQGMLNVYYVSKTAVPVSLTINSAANGSGSCSSIGYPATLSVIPLTPNDPSITGVSSAYTRPITVERR